MTTRLTYHPLSQLPHGPFDDVDDISFIQMFVINTRSGTRVEADREM